MAKAIIILGNGFDLDLGLRTSYADFAKGSQWKELMDGNSHSREEDRLLGYLKSKYETELWIDIEAALLEYAKIKSRKMDFRYAEEDAKDFDALRKALKDYLLEQQGGFTPKEKSVAYPFLRLLTQFSSPNRLYSFNYTHLNVLAGRCGVTTNIDAMHIHGSLADEDEIILGIETRVEIDDRYSFLFKTQNRRYRHTNILKDLKENDEYIFFGHSLNGMDYEYFQNTFVLMSSTRLRTPRLTIITKDKASEDNFKNFLRKHVSLQELYSNAIPEIILTDLVYQKDQTEFKKVKRLFERAEYF